MTPPIPQELYPGILISGSSEAGLAAAREIGATAVRIRSRPARKTSDGDPTLDSGMRVGIIARDAARKPGASRSSASRRTARGRSPQARDEGLRLAVAQAALGAWGQARRRRVPTGWGPFKNYKTFCPYLVGSYDAVAAEIGRYLGVGFRTFILDIPPAEEELDHTAVAFEQALRLVPAR